MRATPAALVIALVLPPLFSHAPAGAAPQQHRATPSLGSPDGDSHEEPAPPEWAARLAQASPMRRTSGRDEMVACGWTNAEPIWNDAYTFVQDVYMPRSGWPWWPYVVYYRPPSAAGIKSTWVFTGPGFRYKRTITSDKESTGSFWRWAYRPPIPTVLGSGFYRLTVRIHGARGGACKTGTYLW